jgi:hypothetical protein
LHAVGGIAVFGNTMSSDCSIHGVRYRFTNWDRVRAWASD